MPCECCNQIDRIKRKTFVATRAGFFFCLFVCARRMSNTTAVTQVARPPYTYPSGLAYPAPPLSHARAAFSSIPELASLQRCTFPSPVSDAHCVCPLPKPRFVAVTCCLMAENGRFLTADDAGGVHGSLWERHEWEVYFHDPTHVLLLHTSRHRICTAEKFLGVYECSAQLYCWR